MQSKYKTLFSNTILFTIGSLGSKFIMFFLVPLYTNVLTTSQYGITELVLTSSNLIIPFITLSINDSILRYSLDKNCDIRTVLKNSIIILSCSSIFLIILYPILDSFELFSNYLNYFIFITILQIFRSAFSVYLKSSNRIQIYIIDSIIYTFSLAFFNIIFLLYLNKAIDGFFISQILSMIVSLIFQITIGDIYRDINIGKIDIKLLKVMILYSTPLIANAVSWWIINSSDRYMLNYIKGADEVGIYAVAAKMPSLVTTITSIFSQAWIISSINEYEDSKDEKFYSNIFGLYSNFLILTSSIVIFIIKPLMNIYVGSNFDNSWRYVPFLLLASIFSTFTNFFAALYKSAKNNMKEVTCTFIGSIINIILNILIIPKLGVMGAVISTLIASFFMASFSIYDTRKFFKFFIDFKKLFSSILLLLLQCFCVIKDFYPNIISIIFIFILINININIIKNLINNLIRYFSKLHIR
ncbi:lipopolysaccharide biosynthesis protein [Clostridium perfringens]|uniref:lipopolysaccharide biosynthesis protein n=1 Tax=Clostridium perfringens TaxID=1502 RepID=UPI0024BC2D2F|nr:oligosaccharide flippase family protein [Clostridium perfringens]